MPLSRYYSGHGESVMREMKDRYGEKGGERIFYATANKMKQGEDKKPKRYRDNAKVGR